MKTRRFSFLVISVLAVVLVAALAFAACDPKHRDQEAEKYTVTFDLGGATGGGISPPEPKTVEKGQSVELPSATWEGHTLLGWSDGEQQYDVGASYTPQKDVKLTAVWGVVNDITGSGTEEDPYVINTPNGLKTFADNVNHPDVEATKDWYKAYFELGADIDMTGVKYTPAGSRATKIGTDEGGSDIKDVLGFQGSFDGNGHTISNLTLEQNARGAEYIGLFGYTLQAYIHDLKMTNVTIRAISGADSSQIRAYIGAVAGYLHISQVDRVEVELNVKMQWLSQNLAVIGGISGMFHSDSGYIAYAENVKSKLDVEIEDFEEGSSVSVLDTAYIGGMFGEVYIGTGAAALVNVSSESNIGGGHVLGGLVGAEVGDNISVINAYAKSTLKPSANVSGEERCYAGGIIGISSGDDIIMDSYADVTVDTNIRASVAGGIVASGIEDDYEEYQTYGLAVVNSYYKLNAGTLTPDKTFGAEATADFGKEFATSTLKWNEQSWNFDGAVPSPTATRARDINGGQYTLTLKDGSSTTTKTYGKGDKNIATIGELEEATNSDNNVFWDWQFADDVDYRYYVPVVKDMTLTAKRFDTSEILAIYEGSSDYNDTFVGAIELMPKGEVNYINSFSGRSTTGDFCYDGEHIIIETLDDDYMCGTLKKNADDKYELQWIWTEGSYEVTYTFVQVDGITLKGEYFSDNGDIITFTGSANLTLIMDGLDATIQATYTQNDGTITISGLENYYASATITDITSESFKTNFVALEGKAEDNKMNYKKMGAVDYSAQPFIGENYLTYTSNEYYELRTITFNADGSLTSSFSSTPGKYYVFGTKVKIFIDSYVSTFELVTVGQNKLMVGIINRGYTAKCSTVLTKASDGKLRSYIINADRNNAVFVNDKGTYYVKDGELQAEATIEGTFADGQFVTLNSTEYLVSEKFHNDDERYLAYTLTPVGPEKGSYTYEGKTFTVNGVDKVTGDIEAEYILNGNNLTMFDIEQEYLFVFDYSAAKAANGNITAEATNDGYRGMYYNANADDPKYYALIFDGVGDCKVFSRYSGEYSGVWGDEWGTYSIQSNGDFYANFSSSQKFVFQFYYDMQLAYSNPQPGCSTSMFKQAIFTAPNYKGSTDIPTFDAAGKYTGQDVELEIKADLTGTLNTKAFTARVDKTNVIIFTVDNVKYTFDASDPENITINGGAYNKVKLTKAETGEKPFPQGTWTGTVTGSFPMLNNKEMTVTFDADGNVNIKAESLDYTGKYTYSSNKLTLTGFGSSNDYSIKKATVTITDEENIKIELQFEDYDMYTFDCTATLKKQAEASDEKPFPQGTWTGTVTVKSGGGWGLGNSTITFIFAADDKVTITAGDYEFDSTYTYSGNSLTCNEAVSSNAKIYEFKFTLSSDSEMELTFKIIDNDEGYGDSEFSTTLTKQAEASDEKPFPQGTWSGYATCTSGMDKEHQSGEMTIKFNADGTFELEIMSKKCSGTYILDENIIKLNAPDNGSYQIETTTFTITISGSSLILTDIRIQETTEYYIWDYDATLTQA